MEWIPIVGYSGLAVLVIAWLVVSFTQPGPRRAVIEWLGALAMYVALLSLFAHLLGRSVERESTVGMIAFGFLVVFFGVGCVLCLAQTVSSLRGPRGTVSSATN
jgi:O-antigen ligase